MLKAALACVVLLVSSGCVGNANDPENQDPSEESVADETTEVDEAATDSPLYVGAQATDSPLY